MKTLTSGLLTLSALSLIAFAPAAIAQSTTYTNQGTFLGDVAPGYYLENFDSLVNGSPYGNSLSFSGGAFSYTASAPSGLYGGAGNGGSALSTNLATDPIVITFTGAPVTAVGGNFFTSDVNGFYTPGSVTVTFSTGDVISIPASTLTDFNGLCVASGSILSLSIASGNATAPPFRWPSVDNLVVGTYSPAAAATPEPGSIALLVGMMTVGAGVLRRRRK